MELKNKTVCFLGDSITQGAEASSADNCFVSLFAKAHPEARVRNFGISGTRIARQTKPSANANHDKLFSGRVEAMPKDADLICVFGGTNDFGHGDARMGSFDDLDDYSFCGALKDLAVKLINRYPTAEIVFFTPLHRASELNPAKKPDGEYLLKDYVEMVRANAEYYSLPVLDLWSVSGMQPSVPVIRDTFMPDGLHPNDAGHKKLFETVDRFIAAL